MDARSRRVLIRPRTMRTLVVLWAGSMLLAWAILVSGWFGAKRQLSRIDRRVVTDIRSLDVAHRLELAILAERHEDLLWKATGQRHHLELADTHLLEAERIVAGLGPYATTREEQDLSTGIQTKLHAFRAGLMSAIPLSFEVEVQLADDLFADMDRFEAQNEAQMKESMLAADLLHEKITHWAVGLSIGTGILLFVGTLALV